MTKIPMPEAGFYRAAEWSPDSKKIAFVDSHLRIWYTDVAGKKTVQVDKERFLSAGNDWVPVWSPDSKWLTYSKRLPNYLGAIHVYSLDSGKATQITDGMSDAKYPVFDRDGKYLYFTASTDAGPSLEPDVGSSARSVTRSIYLAVLTRDQTSPFAPESDEEKAKPATKPDDAKPDVAKSPAPKTLAVQIDFEGIGQRILAMPLPPRRYVGLQAGKAGVLFAIETSPTSPDQPSTTTVHRHDLKTRKTDVAASGVRFFEVSFSGEKMLTRVGDNWYIRSLPPPPPAGGSPGPTPPPSASGPGGGQLNTANIEVRISPPAEWRQMYHEAWRVERDYFYDPGFHGLDLAAAEKRYEPFLEGIASRADLNYLFAVRCWAIWWSGTSLSLEATHARSEARVQSGLLGCLIFKIENKPLPLRSRLQRRELESGSSCAPDSTRNQRPCRRIPAVGGRPECHRGRQRLQLL